MKKYSKIKSNTLAGILAYMASIAILSFMFSCGNSNNNDLPANVVSNPISADGENKLDALPAIEFEETTHNFGDVIQGEKVSYAFKFTNTGKSDLVIAKVSASCGCTATDYPRNAIKPGKGGAISVTFNSENRLGFQNKSVNVMANTQPNLTKLRVKAKIITPDSMNK